MLMYLLRYEVLYGVLVLRTIRTYNHIFRSPSFFQYISHFMYCFNNSGCKFQK